MKIHPHQQQHIPSIKWLINPYKHLGEGRSIALAVATLESAIEMQSMTIYFREFVSPASRPYFISLLKTIAKENYPGYYFWFQKMSIICITEVEYNKRRNIIMKYGRNVL